MLQFSQTRLAPLHDITYAPVVAEHLTRHLSWLQRERFSKRFDKISKRLSSGRSPGFLSQADKFIQLADPVTESIIRLYNDNGLYLFFREYTVGAKLRLRLEAVDTEQAPQLVYMAAAKPLLQKIFRWKRSGMRVDVLLSPSRSGKSVSVELLLGRGSSEKKAGPFVLPLIEGYVN